MHRRLHDRDHDTLHKRPRLLDSSKVGRSHAGAITGCRSGAGYESQLSHFLVAGSRV